jgi:hypothetical protein
MEAATVATSSLGKGPREDARPADAEWTSAGLRAFLRRLDCLLESAMQNLPAERAASPSAPFRGLILTKGDIARVVAQEPLISPFSLVGKLVDTREQPPTTDSPLTWLVRAFQLSHFDVDVLLLALAPEVDLKYEKIFGYLQDDVTRRRPTVELALNLLCASAEEKLACLRHLSSSGALIRNHLLHLVPDPNHVEPPQLAHYLKLDEQVTRLVLGHDELDARLSSLCRILQGYGSLDDLRLAPSFPEGLPTILRQAWDNAETVRLYIRNALPAVRENAARVLAAHVGAQVLALDLSSALHAATAFDEILRIFLREAHFRGFIPYFDHLDALGTPEYARQFKSLMVALADTPGINLLGGADRWSSSPHGPAGVIELRVPPADCVARRALWQTSLETLGVAVEADDLDVAADRFRLDPGQITEAAAMARNSVLLRSLAGSAGEPAHSVGVLTDLLTAARAQCGHELALLARKIEAHYTWNDIVLPPNTLAQLREICARVAHRQRVFGEWGFDGKLSHGKGVNVLFTGPSGCGKTMAAEIIANELQLDLYKIDLSGVISKYIGETEKNLDRIFKAAENSNAILFFDEADALFGKRSEVRDSHDRYANIEVSYLLQKMEEYEGIAILASNQRQCMDEAFIRRLAFTVLFPFPSEADRCRIWNGIWPANLPMADSLDFEHLARRFKLSGGNIKNVALAAAFLAASDGGVVTMAHLFHATQREYEKMGKSLTEAELYGGYDMGKINACGAVGVH